jgi:hypothetical protein
MLRHLTDILGDFNARRTAAGKSPVEIFTKYVPNIYQQKITPAAVTAAIQKSCAALQVSVMTVMIVMVAHLSLLYLAWH